MLSYWESAYEISKPDVTIVGAGIVGLSTAYFLKKQDPNLRVAVLERSFLPNGASSKNAGFACFGSVGELLNDFQEIGVANTLSLVQKRIVGLKLLKDTIGESQINYKQVGGYEIFTEQEAFDKANDTIPHLNKLLNEISGSKTFQAVADGNMNSNGFHGMQQVKGSIFNQYEGAINPMLMMQEWAKKCREEGVKLYMGAELTSFEKHGNKITCQINGKVEITCRKLAFCTNGFTAKYFPVLDIKPARAQVLITSEIPNLEINSTYHLDGGYYYFRNIDGRVLLGGGRNLDFEAETSSELELNEKIQNKLENLLRTTILPGKDFSIEQRWTGIMGVGASKHAIIQEMSSNVFVAARLGGMGVALGTGVGKDLAGMLSA